MKLNIKKITIIVILGFVIGFVLHGELKYTLSNQGSLESIILSKYGGDNSDHIIITETEKINDLLNIIKDKSRKTLIGSVGETPTNIDHYIVLEFIYSTNTSKSPEVNYIYKQKSKYYIEQPYGDIFKIKKESYESIDELFNK